jgi:hypothetical protein
MHAVSGERVPSKSRAAANDNTPAHPAWRRIVAGGMAFVFALTLAVVGLLLCIGPAPAP